MIGGRARLLFDSCRDFEYRDGSASSGPALYDWFGLETNPTEALSAYNVPTKTAGAPGVGTPCNDGDSVVNWYSQALRFGANEGAAPGPPVLPVVYRASGFNGRACVEVAGGTANYAMRPRNVAGAAGTSTTEMLGSTGAFAVVVVFWPTGAIKNKTGSLASESSVAGDTGNAWQFGLAFNTVTSNFEVGFRIFDSNPFTSVYAVIGPSLVPYVAVARCVPRAGPPNFELQLTVNGGATVTSSPTPGITTSSNFLAYGLNVGGFGGDAAAGLLGGVWAKKDATYPTAAEANFQTYFGL
jgi:hypothetical protein